MPDFHEVQLDMGIDYGAVGGAGFFTRVTPMHSGHEKRRIVYTQDLGRWQLGERTIGKSDLRYLDGFFRARRGRGYGFRAKIWSDYELPRQVIATGDGNETAFQIIKTYPDDIDSYVKTIKKIVDGTVAVWVDGAGVDEADYSVDLNTGIITFDTAPPNLDLIEVSCEFDTPVRFDEDRFNANFVAYDEPSGEAHFFLHSLPIQEIRV